MAKDYIVPTRSAKKSKAMPVRIVRAPAKASKKSKQEKTTRFIGKVLSRGIKYIKAHYTGNVTLNQGLSSFYNDVIVTDIPKYDGGGTGRVNNLQLARTDDTLYFKSMKLAFACTNYGDKPVVLRVLIFRNDSWNEALNTATMGNLFYNEQENDTAPSTLSNVLVNQPFNRNLIRSSKSLLLDRTVKVNARTFSTWDGSNIAYQPSGNRDRGFTHFKKYMPVNQKVDFETDVIGEQIKNGRYNMVVLYSNDDNTNAGNCVFDYFLSCYCAQP